MLGRSELGQVCRYKPTYLASCRPTVTAGPALAELTLSATSHASKPALVQVSAVLCRQTRILCYPDRVGTLGFIQAHDHSRSTDSKAPSQLLELDSFALFYFSLRYKAELQTRFRHSFDLDNTLSVVCPCHYFQVKHPVIWKQSAAAKLQRLVQHDGVAVVPKASRHQFPE